MNTKWNNSCQTNDNELGINIYQDEQKIVTPLLHSMLIHSKVMTIIAVGIY